ncbi:unnamed protein product [Lasius platythorax]|uniref:Uncharacterized protein n=1 Tax=Lasius platythorax TaxID=488582 RepID=A0AAV2NQJ5_9HYME
MEFNPAQTLKEVNISWNTSSWDLVEEHLMLPGKCMEINCAFGNTTRQEFQNVFDMLKSKGCFHMAFVVTHDALRLYNNMEIHPVYDKYFKKYSSPFHYAINPEEDVKQLLRNVGFTIKYCRTKSDMMCKTDYLLPYILFGLPFIEELPLDQARDVKEKLTTKFNKLEEMFINTTSQFLKRILKGFAILKGFTKESNEIEISSLCLI